jgi:hypothetical protein
MMNQPVLKPPLLPLNNTVKKPLPSGKPAKGMLNSKFAKPASKEPLTMQKRPQRRPWKLWKFNLDDLLAVIVGDVYISACCLASGGAGVKVAFVTRLHGFTADGQVSEWQQRTNWSDILDVDAVQKQAAFNRERLEKLKAELTQRDRSVGVGLIHDSPVFEG